MMPAIFKYFWFLCAAIMLVNVFVWRRRLRVTVDRGIATNAEVERFVWWVGAWLVGGPIVLGVIGLAAGWRSPFCAEIFSFDTAPRLLTSMVNVGACGTLLWWVWRGSGADFLGRVGPALATNPSYKKRYSPTAVRLTITALVLGSSIAAFMMPRSTPAFPDRCSATIDHA